MCLGVPGRITEINTKGGLRLAWVDFGGVSREVCPDCVPEAAADDRYTVHVGFAISLLSEAEARETRSMLEQIAEIGDDTPTASAAMGDLEHGNLSPASYGSGR